MRIPWVSRVACENALEAERRGTRSVLDMLDAERKRFDDLLAKYHALKLQGAVVVEPPPAPIVIAPAAPDPIRDKIREQVRANPGIAGLGSYLTDYARELRDEKNMTPSQIIAHLGKWESSEDASAAVESYVETARELDDEATV